MGRSHLLLVTFPAQGHINPTLQFAKRLVRLGAQVTFLTTVSAHRRMTKSSTPDGLSFVTYSDGHDDGVESDIDFDHYLSELEGRGSQTLTDLIVSNTNEGRRFACLVWTTLVPWAADVAFAHQLLSALLWIQPATVFDIYYYYSKGHGDLIRSCSGDPSCSIELPGLPLLTTSDLPSFLLSSNTYAFALPTLQRQQAALERLRNPGVLVNTFDALEPKALRVIKEFNVIGIGPLIPSAFLDGKDPSDTSFGGDLFQGSKDYIEWLNSKPESSVVYVSFGSLAALKKQQMEEIARGLLDCGQPFLWVIRGQETEESRLSCKGELEERGMIVPWCSQVEVLSHPSLGCFVTHCGWNSSLESLVSGVPVVAFPQWSDQSTNAKLMEDVWKTGIRVTANEEGIVEGDETNRCLDLVIGGGERGEEMRRNAKKWKDLARKAVMEDGSSYKNLTAFMQEMEECCH